MNFENATSVIGLLGIGGIAGTYFRVLWERKTTALENKQQFKEARYKCLLLLMHTAVDFDRQIEHLQQHRPTLRTYDDLRDELETEWQNMLLYASEDALVKVHAFIRSPSVQTFKPAVLAMRADLWGSGVSRSVETLDFEFPRRRV